MNELNFERTISPLKMANEFAFKDELKQVDQRVNHPSSGSSL